MNKSTIAFMLVLISIVLLPLSFASAENSPPFSKILTPSDEAMFVLPASLNMIDDEAFEGTAVTAVLIRERVICIGDYAFANTPKLQVVFIPQATEHIGDYAFPANTGLTIYGAMGSYAEEWANAHQIPFDGVYFWNLLIPNRKTINIQGISHKRILLIINPERTVGIIQQTAFNEMSMRPQDRPELNPIDYRFP